jgi:hypothetical protein
MSASRPALVVALLLFGGLAQAADEEMPDEEFLEYLGLWEESDEDWLMFEKSLTTENEEGVDPVPDGEESTETDDES